MTALAIRGSSHIAGADYDAETRILTVYFQDGDAYEYSQVPPEVAAAFERAPSAGQYFHRMIRQRYVGVPT